MELRDHMDNCQGNTAPTGKTGPEITSKATVSVLLCSQKLNSVDCFRKKSLSQILSVQTTQQVSLTNSESHRFTLCLKKPVSFFPESIFLQYQHPQFLVNAGIWIINNLREKEEFCQIKQEDKTHWFIQFITIKKCTNPFGCSDENWNGKLFLKKYRFPITFKIQSMQFHLFS